MADASKIKIGDRIYNLNDADVQIRLDQQIKRAEQVQAELQNKISKIGKIQINPNYVTPEMYGALGDGVNDDGPALQACLQANLHVCLTQDLYVKSIIYVSNKDTYFEGNGHTIHVDYTGLFDQLGYTFDGICFASETVTDAEEQAEAPCRLVSENIIISKTIRKTGGTYTSPYCRGYISYKGYNPTPTKQTYENPWIQYWNEYHTTIKNLRIVVDKNGAGKGARLLLLRKMCHSVIDNVQVICNDKDGDCATGIGCRQAIDVKILNCFAYNFTAYNTSGQSNEGYGIVTSGEGVYISHCTCTDCKHSIASGGGVVFDTNLVVSDCVFNRLQTEEIRPVSYTHKYLQILDVHGPSHNPTFNNIEINIRDASSTGSTMPIYIRCPEAHLNNIHINSENTCQFTLGELAQRIYVDNLIAPNCNITPMSALPPELQLVQISNSVIHDVEQADDDFILRLVNTTVNTHIDAVNNLEMYDSRILKDEDWPSKPSITIYGKATIYNSEIYCHRNAQTSISKKTFTIKAPANSCIIIGCHIYKRSGDDYKVSQYDQAYSNCIYQDAYGFMIGDNNSKLDYYNLY